MVRTVRAVNFFYESTFFQNINIHFKLVYNKKLLSFSNERDFNKDIKLLRLRAAEK